MGNRRKRGSSNLSFWQKIKGLLFKELWRDAREFIFIIQLMRLKRKANKVALKTGMQHFIIKAEGVPTLMSRSEIVWMRQHGIIPRNVTFEHIKKAALHVTSLKK